MPPPSAEYVARFREKQKQGMGATRVPDRARPPPVLTALDGRDVDGPSWVHTALLLVTGGAIIALAGLRLHADGGWEGDIVLKVVRPH